MAAISDATRNASVALDFFMDNLVNGHESHCPPSHSRSRQLLVLFWQDNLPGQPTSQTLVFWAACPLLSQKTKLKTD
jgi:hypothetical protein